MRNMLALLGALLVAFAGIGWYQDWYHLAVSKTPDGSLRVQTDVNTDKVVTDSGNALKRVGTAIGEQLDKSGPSTAPAAPTPPKTDGKVSIFGISIGKDGGK